MNEDGMEMSKPAHWTRIRWHVANSYLVTAQGGFGRVCPQADPGDAEGGLVRVTACQVPVKGSSLAAGGMS